jgi:hypothetical protein
MKKLYPKDYYDPKRRWNAQQIAAWMETVDVYANNAILINAWRLGRYMQAHKSQLESSIKLYQDGKRANALVYGIYRHEAPV